MKSKKKPHSSTLSIGINHKTQGCKSYFPQGKFSRWSKWWYYTKKMNKRLVIAGHWKEATSAGIKAQWDTRIGSWKISKWIHQPSNLMRWSEPNSSMRLKLPYLTERSSHKMENGKLKLRILSDRVGFMWSYWRLFCSVVSSLLGNVVNAWKG